MLLLLYRQPLYQPVYELQLQRMLGAQLIEDGLMNTDHPFDHSLFNTLVGVRCVLEAIVSASTTDDLVQSLKERSLSADDFMIDYHRIGRHHHRIPSRRLLGQLASHIQGNVSFDQPKTRFLLVETSRHYYLTRRLGECASTWPNYANRPHAFSAALSTQLAGLAINLVAQKGDTLIDPTCGSGTVIYEALCRGIMARGSDLKWQWVTRSRENLSAFGFQQAPSNGPNGTHSSLLISQGDAREIRFTADALVSNLPYGRQVPASDQMLKEILINLSSQALHFAFFSGISIEPWLSELGYHSIIEFNLTRQQSHPRYLTVAKGVST